MPALRSRVDWVDLLEAAYALGADDASWRDRLLESTSRLLPEADLFAFIELRVVGGEYVVEGVSGETPDAGAAAVLANTSAPPQALDLVYGRAAFAGSLSEQVFPQIPGAQERFTEATGRSDVVGLAGNTGDGRIAAIAVSPEHPVRIDPRQRGRWERAMIHIAAGLRLRRALERHGAPDPATSATLAPDGRVLDRADALPATALETIRDAVIRTERAKTRAPDEALEAWAGLVDGRFSLVDRFDTDGKRFVIAVENEPQHRDPRGLTRRERQLAEYVGLGQSTKEIAYTLGISLSTVSMGVSSACRKLGLETRAELAAFFAPRGLRARLSHLRVAGEELLVGVIPFVDEASMERLTPSEREVAVLVLSGSTTADIAAARQTSESTVTNQIASIFRKFGVLSRVELAARLYGAGSDG